MHVGAYKVRSVRLFLRLSRLAYVLIAVLLYFLGIGIAHYLVGQVNWGSFFLGFLWVILTLLGFQYLNEYFDLSVGSDDPPWWRTPFSGSSGAIGVGKLTRQTAFWAGLSCLTVAASLTALLIRSKTLSSLSLVLIGMFAVGELAFTLPPIRLVASGYGELVMSLLRVGIIPALAFTLQGHDMHRLIIMVAFPLVIIHVGMLLAMELPSYASDVKYEKHTLTVKIGWQRSMQLHNFLILGGFLIFGLAVVLGLPFSVGWPVLFVLPVALVQIWIMNRIADGVRPNWNLLVLVALATFCLAAYLLTFNFWTH
jgi:1,4-dihydroxy-2-naphthoate octaprenyltransferase